MPMNFWQFMTITLGFTMMVSLVNVLSLDPEPAITLDRILFLIVTIGFFTSITYYIKEIIKLNKTSMVQENDL